MLYTFRSIFEVEYNKDAMVLDYIHRGCIKLATNIPLHQVERSNREM